MHYRGDFPLEGMITHYNVRDFEQAFEDIKSGRTVKAILQWN